jgi:hypothetical protein
MNNGDIGKIIGEESGFEPSFDLRSVFFKLFAKSKKFTEITKTNYQMSLWMYVS